MESWLVKLTDQFLKPWEYYHYHNLLLEGHRLIVTKTDQSNAGSLKPPASKEKTTCFGMNPVQPYRDYYGSFVLKTKLIPEELVIKFAIGYDFHTKVVTVDDYSLFSWLRLAIATPEMLYPNLSEQKQLFDYFLKNAQKPRLIIIRTYHYLQNEIRQQVIDLILKSEEKLKTTDTVNLFSNQP